MKTSADSSAITVSGVTQRFGRRCAVNNVSLEIARGEVFGLLGANGAGKTTLIKTITTLLPPQEGTVTIEGIDVYRSRRLARQCFGVVFQGSSLDDEMTPSEHMDLHAAFYGMPVREGRLSRDELLESFDLWHIRSERVRNFSGGERRRLEIARSFLHKPSVLFLDEPTVGLDASARRNLWALLHRLRSERNLTIFLTTHYLEEIETASTHVAVMDKGIIIAQGSPSVLMATTAVGTLEAAFLALMDQRRTETISTQSIALTLEESR